jgi:hypothetical protein
MVRDWSISRQHWESNMTDLISAIAVLVLLSSWCIYLWIARIKSNKRIDRMWEHGLRELQRTGKLK